MKRMIRWLALGLTLRNRWGMSENTQVTIDTISGTSGMPDPYITIHNFLD